MIGKSLAVGIVVGGALSQSFHKSFKTAKDKADALGASLRHSGKQQASIAQFKALKKSVGNTATSMKAAQAKVNALAKQIKLADKPSKQLIRDFEQAKHKSAGLKSSFQRQNEQLHRLRIGLRGAGIDTLKLGRDEKILGRSIDATRHKMEHMNKAQAAKGRLGALKGRALGAIGAIYGASRLIGDEADVEKRFTRLGIQANISKQKVEELRQKILDVSLSENTKIDPTKTLAAIEAIIEKTGDLGFAEKNIKGIALAISATGASGSAIGELTAELEKMQAFKAPGDVLKALDVFNVQGKEGAFTLQNLAALGPRVITAYTAAVKGGRDGAQTLREMGAALQEIRMGTGTAEQAATAFEALLRTLQDSQKIKKLSELGIQVFDPNQQGKEVLRPINELMLEIQKATGGKKTILGGIFEAEAIRAFNAIDPAKMKHFMQVQGDGATTIRDSKRAADEASQSLMAFKVVVLEIGRAIAGTLMPAVKPVLDTLASGAKWIGAMIRRVPVIGEIIGGLAIGFAGYAAILGTVTAAQWLWNTSLVAGYGNMVKTTAGALWAGGVYVASAAKIGAVTAAQWLWNAAMTANPIGLVIAGVAALAAGAFFLYKNWDSVMKWFSKKLDWLADKFSFVGDTWHSIFGGGDKKTSVTHHVKQVFDTIKKPVFTKAAPAALAASLALAPSALPAASQPHSAPVINNGAINITVHAAPGMDEQALAGQVRQQVDQAMTDSLNRYQAERRGRLYD